MDLGLFEISKGPCFRGGLDLGLFSKSNRPSRRGELDIGLSKRANPNRRGGVVQSDARIRQRKGEFPGTPRTHAYPDSWVVATCGRNRNTVPKPGVLPFSRHLVSEPLARTARGPRCPPPRRGRSALDLHETRGEVVCSRPHVLPEAGERGEREGHGGRVGLCRVDEEDKKKTMSKIMA